MNKSEQISFYWQRINKIEERIFELSNKDCNYLSESNKRKVLLRNVKHLEKQKEDLK